MTLLAGKQLHDVIDHGFIDALHENVGASSIDVRLGENLKLEMAPVGRERCEVELASKQDLVWMDKVMHPHGCVIEPGEFFLAHTMETFNLPDDISCEFKLRSSVARSGLQHMLAGWADAGFHSSQLTLEFYNVSRYHSLVIRPGMRIGQMVFYQHAHAGDNSYRIKGRYNHQQGVQESKGV